MDPDQGRVVIEGVHPEIDTGRFPIKRAIGEEVVVTADIFGDGHDVVAALVKYRHDSNSEWHETPMSASRGVSVDRFLQVISAPFSRSRSFAADLTARPV